MVLQQVCSWVCTLPLKERLDLHIFVLLEDSVCIKHGSIIHFFHIRTRLGSLEKEKVSVSQSLSSPISLPFSSYPFPPMEVALLTIATQPRAWILSLTADRWLNNLLPRFFSRKVTTSWICSEMGANKSESLFWEKMQEKIQVRVFLQNALYVGQLWSWRQEFFMDYHEYPNKLCIHPADSWAEILLIISLSSELQLLKLDFVVLHDQDPHSSYTRKFYHFSHLSVFCPTHRRYQFISGPLLMIVSSFSIYPNTPHAAWGTALQLQPHRSPPAFIVSITHFGTSSHTGTNY